MNNRIYNDVAIILNADNLSVEFGSVKSIVYTIDNFNYRYETRYKFLGNDRDTVFIGSFGDTVSDKILYNVLKTISPVGISLEFYKKL